MCFLKKFEKFYLLMRAGKEILGCHGQIKLFKSWRCFYLEKTGDIGFVMGQDQEIIMALAMIRHMFHKGEISEIVYKNIRKEYLPKIRSVALREKL